MKSMINEAKFTRRYKLEDYEFEEFTLGAIVDESESGVDVLIEMKKQVNEAFVGEKKPETKAEKKADKKEKKNAGKKASPSNTDDEESDADDTAEETGGTGDEGDSDDEAADASTDDNADDSSDDEDGAEGEEEAPAKKGKGKSEEKTGGKKFKKKPQSYNRTIEQHKEIFSGVLRSVSPDWKKSDDTKAKAKKASESLEGEPFLDENGEVLDSFKAMVRNHMKTKAKK